MSAHAVVVLLLWLVGCATTALRGLGPWGLLPALSPAWWAALAVALAGVLVVLARERLSRAHAAVVTSVLGLVLYATPAQVGASPHYTYVYKHIGVSRYILEQGTVDPSIDIYHRWPAAFALGAYVTELTGLENPVRFAAWVEPVLSLLVAALVLAVALELGLSERVAWASATMALVLNWVGQAYYAPQGLAVVLAMGVVLLLARHLGRRRSPLERLLPRRLRSAPPEGRGTERPTPAVLVVVVALHVAIVVSHQLTPYILLLGIGSLVALGLVRFSWGVPLLALLGVMTVAFLVPNYAYLDSSFGLLQGFDPLGHVRSPVEESGLSPVMEKVWLGRAALLLHLSMWIVTAVSLCVMLAQRRAPLALTLGALAFSPALLLVLQSYGGEARLRVFLFSMPWCAVAIAWLLEDCRQRTGRARRLVPPTVVVCFAALFVPGFYGNEDLNTMPADEVVAAEVLYRDAPPGAVVMLAAQGFPERYGPRYPAFPLDRNDLTPALTRDVDVLEELQRGAPPAEVAAREMRAYASRGYLVFSTTQERYATAYQLLPDLGYDGLEAAIAGSTSFRRVLDRPDARVYELTQ